MLRHQFSFMAFLIMSTSISMAQITQINPYYGITLPMPLQTYNGEFNTEGGNNFGLNVSFGQWTSELDFSANQFYEFQYNYHKSPLSYYAYGSGDLEDLGVLKMHNALLGLLKGVGNEIFEGYAGLYAGVTIFDVEDPEAFDYTRFTMAAGAGIKYYPSIYFGIRLHTQLYLPFWPSSLNMGWTGGDSGTISTLATPYLNFNLGIFANIDRTY